MKKITENRPIAWVVLALVVLGSLFIGGGNVIAGRAGQVSDLFFKTEDGVYEMLGEMADGAEIMASLAQNSDGADMAQVGVVSEQIETLRASKSVAECGAAVTGMTTAIENLYSGLDRMGLSEADASEFRYQYKNYKDVLMIVDREDDAYNSAAEEFNAMRGGFPAGLISAVRGIGEAELFR